MNKTVIVIFAFLASVLEFSTGLYSQEKNIKLNVMTYNVHHCNPPAVKGLIDVQAIADVIKSNNVNIAFLQEIDVHTTRANGLDQANELSQKSGLNYFHFFKAIDILGGEYGVMILSAYPLDSCIVNKLYQEGESEQRVLGTAIITLSNTIKVKIACTHLDLSARLRSVELNQIDSILSKGSLPFILGGDFNATPQSQEMKIMLEKYKSSTNEFIPTFPNINPDRTIDFLLINKSVTLEIVSHKVLTNIHASDHLPVLAEILCCD